MDKQKQIEEMAKTMCFQRDSCPVKSCIGVNCEKTWLAEALYNAGYRKIPEGAVVLTREAYNRLFTKARQSEIKTIDLESIVNARKETAEKFAERVKMAFYYEFDELIPSIMADKIDEIAKEITGGEKEISDETV